MALQQHQNYYVLCSQLTVRKTDLLFYCVISSTMHEESEDDDK